MRSGFVPPISVDHLSPDARAIAQLVYAPDHAWAKEFVRAYLGPEFATRAIIRTVAPRLIEPDALIGITLELIRGAARRIHPNDAMALLAATPVLPGPIARDLPVTLPQLFERVLVHYDRDTCMRILLSLVHTTAQEYARALEPELHTPSSLRYTLSVRDETVVDDLLDWIEDPISPELAAPFAEVFPALLEGDIRDETFAGGLLLSPSITRALSNELLATAIDQLWSSGRPEHCAAIFAATANPNLLRRAPTLLPDLVYRTLRREGATARAAALRTLAEPAIHNFSPRASVVALRSALKSTNADYIAAAIDVVGTAGFTRLGADGERFFTQRVEEWIRSRRRAASAARTLLYLAEADETRDRLDPLLTERVLRRLEEDPEPEIRERADGVRQYLADPDAFAPEERYTIPTSRNLNILTRAISIIADRDGAQHE